MKYEKAIGEVILFNFGEMMMTSANGYRDCGGYNGNVEGIGYCGGFSGYSESYQDFVCLNYNPQSPWQESKKCNSVYCNDVWD